MAALVADALTAFRLCLTLYLVWVGFSSSDKVSALTLIVYALLVGWTADILDGWFARKSNSPTRLGHLDFPLDMVMVAGSLLGITALGYIPAKVAAAYFAVAVALVWKFPSKSTTMAVACPAVFAPFILAAFECPYAFRLSLLWALLVLMLDWSRFEGVVLEFIDTFPGGKLKPIGEKWRKWRGLTQIGNAYNDANGKM
jgi:hypothetical protein